MAASAAAAASSFSACSPREHIERIRRERYYIGKEEKNPLAEDMHQAVNYLSEELYAKDVHFLMELIQNAEDNKYAKGVTPSLQFIITSKDITMTGAKATLLLFNNEIGFSPSNIDSICRIGKSTKKGNRQLGYIGEKGIGFKSVFLISSKPHVFSNGYQIRFDEEPSPDCNLGYIVPEWVEENPCLSDIQSVYGPSKTLPATTIILPLKAEKESAVKKQLSNLHPELLLFLSKIRQLSVREDNDDPKHNTVSQISISSEANYQSRKNLNAESYTLFLAAQEDNKDQEDQCCYYMWKQKFPVKPERIVKKRVGVDEWVITLAFPYGRRLNRGMKTCGVYSFLPTEMATGFPFIIQADFLLVSSRESICEDNPWNKGILDCVPTAFISAFSTLVKGAPDAPSFSIPSLFNFIPVADSLIPMLDPVRVSIKQKVIAEHIIPCESYTKQKIFCKPTEISRLHPSFWRVLNVAQKSGVHIGNLHSHGRYIVNSYFDDKEYDRVLGYLGVGYVDTAWYVKFIGSSDLVNKSPEAVYLELLSFISKKWNGCFGDLPLLKFVDGSGGTSLLSVSGAQNGGQSLCIARDFHHISWLISWNREFMSVSNQIFMPQSTQESLRAFEAGLLDWLQNSKILKRVSTYDYGSTVVNALSNKGHVISFTHFLYHCQKCRYISDWYIDQLSSSLPIVDDYGLVVAQMKEVLVPAKVSNWAGLIGSNPWRSEGYVVLSTEYLSPGKFAGKHTPEGKLLDFLRKYAKATDVPNVYPPNASFVTVFSPLMKENVFLLLDWLRNIKSRGTSNLQNFLNCIKSGNWLKTSIGYSSPSQSFLPESDWGNLLQIESVLVDIPLIDREFYGEEITNYTEELGLIGVRFEFKEALEYIGDHLMQIAGTSTFTRGNVLSLLMLIRYLREKYLPSDVLIRTVKDGKWLKTSNGFRTPSESILYDSPWRIAEQVSNLPFIDTGFYGDAIVEYKTELALLGVLVEFNQNYQVVIDNFKMPPSCTSADCAIFILECLKNAEVPDNVIMKTKNAKWLKTHLGYNTPGESYLVAPVYDCLVQVADGVPIIDDNFYEGRIRSYQAELQKVGVGVRINDVSKAVANQLKILASSSSIKRKNVLALLATYRRFEKMQYKFPDSLSEFINDSPWLYTLMGFRSPKCSILYSSEWDSVSPIASLPLIVGNSSYYGCSNAIYEYKEELEKFGVAVEFDDGAKFVIDGIRIPKDPSAITPANVLSLLKCIQIQKGGKDGLPEAFMKSMRKRWLKTTMGYKYPKKCILFDSKWGLQREDGPFIDEIFYGEDILSFADELNEIGVVADAITGCALLASHIKCHSDITAISRVYMHLFKNKWEPVDPDAELIWIPNKSGTGEWVSSRGCIIQDKLHLFGSQLIVLDNYYEEKVLRFFSTMLGVRHGPNTEDYCKLWRSWEASVHQLTSAECSAFWEFIAKHWKSNTEKLLRECISKLPVQKNHDIILADTQDVFIPDDLLLKDLFETLPDQALFVWYPPTSTPPLTRAKLNKIYSSIGVRTISESVEKDESFAASTVNVQEGKPKSIVLMTGLLRIILGYLCDASLNLSSDERHCVVQKLIGLKVLKVDNAITVSYMVSLSSGKTLVTEARKLFRWEKDDSTLFIQSDDELKGKRRRMEFSTYFAEVIAQGLLFEMSDHIAPLADLIKLGYLVDFDHDAVEFLLKSKNLQLFAEDEEFLSSLTSSGA